MPIRKKNFNDHETYGGRAALKIDLNDNWTITPTFMYQNSRRRMASFFMDEDQGDLEDAALPARSRRATSSRKQR